MTAASYRDDFAACSRWMWPLAAAAARMPVDKGFPTHAQLSVLYAECAHPEAPRLRFVDDKKRGRRPRTPGAAERYDGRIALQAEVPTRAANWHDLLNALCFATFARAKCALHQRQFELLRQVEASLQVHGEVRGPWPSSRTREQDALTLFDEGGVVLAVRGEELEAELKRADAPSALAEACEAGRARVVPFGHAVLEHLVLDKPPPFAGGRVLGVDVPLGDDQALLAAVDHALRAQLCDREEFREPRKPGLAVRLAPAGAEFASGHRHAFAACC